MELEKRGPGRPPKKPENVTLTLPVKILRGYWPEGLGEKVWPGAVVDLPAEEARRIVGLGIAERADPF